jgi:hypothetical protein
VIKEEEKYNLLLEVQSIELEKKNTTLSNNRERL